MNRSILLFLVIATLALLSRSTVSSSSDLDDFPSLAVSCDIIERSLLPCLPYIEGKTNEPSTDCCSGAARISDDIKDSNAKKALCQCIQKSLGSVGSYDKNFIPLVPQKCGLTITLPPIDASTQCQLQG